MTNEIVQRLNFIVGPIILGLFVLFLILEHFLSALPFPIDRAKHGFRNVMISIINIRILSLGGLLVFGVSVASQNQDIGLLYRLGYENEIYMVILGVLAYDLLNYTVHRSLHKIPWLWRVHRVHHSDPYIDATSAFYFNPLESTYRSCIQAFFVFLIGLPPLTLALHTLLVVSALLFSHSNFRISKNFERIFKYILVLPNAHRVHHSVLRNEHDSNFGITFMMWDHLFKTYTAPNNENQFRIGLNEYANIKLGIFETLVDPLKKR